MRKTTPECAFEDVRGTITDLIEQPINAVTRIQTRAGAVRGNHLHELTTQWAYVITGRLVVVTASGRVTVGPGEMVVNEPGEPHAWQALEDTDCIVFACGPRAGSHYESDTIRLDEPLLT